jgi:hypothetical protein
MQKLRDRNCLKKLIQTPWESQHKITNGIYRVHLVGKTLICFMIRGSYIKHARKLLNYFGFPQQIFVVTSRGGHRYTLL